MLKPKVVTITFTGRCNARCIMCSIWKRKEASTTDLTLEEYKKVFQESRLLKNVGIVNITGGEPFLRKDITEFVRFLIDKCPYLEEIRFASNGLMPELIRKRMEEIVKLKCKFNIKISIDGVGKIHNSIRGNKKAFEMAEKTVDYLTKIAKKNKNLNVALAHTIMPENYNEMPKIINHFKRKDIDIIQKMVYHAESFKNKDKDIAFNKEQKKIVINNLSKLLKYQDNIIKKSKIGWRKIKMISYFLYARYQYDLLKGKTKFMPCHATFSSLTFESDGKVYSCGIIYGLLGDIKKEPFDKIWLNKRNKKLRDFINEGKCQCSNACDTIPSLIVNNSLFVLRKFLL